VALCVLAKKNVNKNVYGLLIGGMWVAIMIGNYDSESRMNPFWLIARKVSEWSRTGE